MVLYSVPCVVATKYIDIAESLVESIESDHLLALLLEVPSDIDQMNVFDIAIQFGLDDFFDNNRVDRVITHMHHQFGVFSLSTSFYLWTVIHAVFPLFFRFSEPELDVSYSGDDHL